MAMDCIICAEEIDGKNRLFAYTSCGHSDICSICYLRMRALQRVMHCPSCKASADHVVCSPKGDEAFDNFQIWGDSCGDLILDQRGQMFFPRDYHRHKVEPLWSLKCKTCKQSKRDLKALRSHVKQEHNLQLCLLCIENRQSFPVEHKYYTVKEYENHLKKGDGDGSEGHPNCEFCRKRFFDKTALFTHLYQDHFTCHICQRQGVQHTYYSTYETLEAHFRDEHYLCEDPECLAKRFIVFANSIDFAGHNMQWHPFSQINKQNRFVEVGFRYRGSGDGQEEVEDNRDSKKKKNAAQKQRERDEKKQSSDAGDGEFDGGVAGRVHDGEWQVETTNRVLDPRDPNRSTAVPLEPSSAAEMVAQAEASEAFPALEAAPSRGSGPSGLGLGGPAVGGGGRSIIGWGDRVNVKVTTKKKAGVAGGGSGPPARSENDFPSLGGGKKKGGSAASFKSVANGSDNSGLPLAVRLHMGEEIDPDMLAAMRIAEAADNVDARGAPTAAASADWAVKVTKKASAAAAAPAQAPPQAVPTKDDFPDGLSSSKPSANASAPSNTTTKKAASKVKASSGASGSGAGSWGSALGGIGVPTAAPKAKKTGVSVIRTVKKAKSGSDLERTASTEAKGSVSASGSASAVSMPTSASVPSFSNMKVLNRDDEETYMPPPRPPSDPIQSASMPPSVSDFPDLPPPGFSKHGAGSSSTYKPPSIGTSWVKQMGGTSESRGKNGQAQSQHKAPALDESAYPSLGGGVGGGGGKKQKGKNQR